VSVGHGNPTRPGSDRVGRGGRDGTSASDSDSGTAVHHVYCDLGTPPAPATRCRPSAVPAHTRSQLDRALHRGHGGLGGDLEEPGGRGKSWQRRCILAPSSKQILVFLLTNQTILIIFPCYLYHFQEFSLNFNSQICPNSTFHILSKKKLVVSVMFSLLLFVRMALVPYLSLYKRSSFDSLFAVH